MSDRHILFGIGAIVFLMVVIVAILHTSYDSRLLEIGRASCRERV